MDLTGKTVVVTGASGGIGESFARQLAGAGAIVVAVARGADKLAALAASVTGPGRVEPVPLDLLEPDSGERLQARVAELGLEVFGLVNNAGLGGLGSFVEVGRDRSVEQIDLDIRAVVDLTARFLPAMVAARAGFVINLSSTSSYQPTPGLTVYGAAKAFIRSFTEGLWFEVKDAGVRVFGIAPGTVQTGFFDAAGGEFMTKHRMTPDDVARIALDHLDATTPMVVPGWRNKVGTLGSRLAPRRALIAVSARMVAPTKG